MIAYNVKLVCIFFILNGKMFQLITQKHMSVEYGSAVVLKSPQKNKFFNRRFPKCHDFFPFENKTHLRINFIYSKNFFFKH